MVKEKRTSMKRKPLLRKSWIPLKVLDVKKTWIWNGDTDAYASSRPYGKGIEAKNYLSFRRGKNGFH